MRYDIISEAMRVNAHILLPKGKKCKKLYVNGNETAFKNSIVGDPQYVDVSVEGENTLRFEIVFE